MTGRIPAPFLPTRLNHSITRPCYFFSMKRPALYSAAKPTPAEPPSAVVEAPGAGVAAVAPAGPGRIRSFVRRHDRGILLLGGMLIALALFITRDRMQPAPRELAQDDIDAAVCTRWRIRRCHPVRPRPPPP